MSGLGRFEDHFEDDPGAGQQYDHPPITVNIDVGDGVRRRVVIRWRKRQGRIERFSVALESASGGRLEAIVWYDDHRGFHRHRAGPGKQPVEQTLDSVPRNEQIAYAVQELKSCYRKFESEVKGGEDNV